MRENNQRRHQQIFKRIGLGPTALALIVSACALGFYCLSLCGFIRETSPSQKSEEPLQHGVTVTLKLIQVYVLDGEGRPATDLTIDDFELEEDGRSKKLTEFEKHILPGPGEKAIERPLETLEPAVPPKLKRKFFIFLDILGNDQNGVIKAKRAALHFLETQVQPDDEVGLLGYTRLRGFIVQQYLTTDHEKIRKAVGKLREIAGTGLTAGSFPVAPATSGDLARETARAEAEAGIGESSVTEALGGGFILPPMPDIPGRNRRDFSRDITDIAKALRTVPGYKNLVLFTGDTPGPVANTIAREFASASCPVFVINTMKDPNRQNERAVLIEKQLQELASLSGGRYFDNVKEYAAISSEIQSITGNFYVLGYYVSEKWDGSFHRISVRIKKPGYRVFAQGGYFSPKPFAEMNPMEKQFHLIDLALNDQPYHQAPAHFPVMVLPVEREGKTFGLTISEIRKDELEEVVSGKCEVVSLIFDQKRAIIESFRGELDFSELKEPVIYHYTVVPLPPGRYESRLVLRNTVSGRGAVAFAQTVVENIPASGLALSQPLVFVPEKDVRFIRFSKKPVKSGPPLPPSINEFFAFFPPSHRILIQDLDKADSRLIISVWCRKPPVRDPEIEIFASIIPKTSEEKSPAEVILAGVHKETEKDCLLLDVRPGDLRPGDYELEIEAVENKTGEIARVRKPFTIR